MAEPLNIRAMRPEDKLQHALKLSLPHMPTEVRADIEAILSPTALATMAAAMIIWAASHMVGVGEIADVALLIVGYVALGGVAIEAGGELMSFCTTTLNAQSEAELEKAGKHLARAVALLSVQVVLAILFRNRPKETFKRTLEGKKLPPIKKALSKRAPRGPGLRYKPTLTFTDKLPIGKGATNLKGDIRIGRGGARFIDPKLRSEQMTLARFHERAHQLLVPKIYVLRELRMYLKQNAYLRSYLMRYLQEALAETVAQCRVHRISPKNILTGLKFPLNGNYEITLALLGTEARGLLLGSVTAGAMTYNVYYGARHFGR